MKSKTKKGKQRQKSIVNSPPEPTALAAEEVQSKGPLGAPILSTSEPQVLEEEAEEEDPTFEIGEATPDLTQEDEPVPGAQENRQWGGIDNTTSPFSNDGVEDEFRNVWGSDRL